MGISDLIASFIRESLEDADGVLELQRGDLAERFHCVPSQINYVMSTRFSPENGYIVESRRGGGGYIRITRVRMDRPTLLMSVINSIGGSIDGQSASAIVRNLTDADALSASASVRLRTIALALCPSMLPPIELITDISSVGLSIRTLVMRL